jgi:hypothetical protein
VRNSASCGTRKAAIPTVTLVNVNDPSSACDSRQVRLDAFKREVALAWQREEGRDSRICKPSVRCRRVLGLGAPDIESGSMQVDGDHGLSEPVLKPRRAARQPHCGLNMRAVRRERHPRMHPVLARDVRNACVSGDESIRSR